VSLAFWLIQSLNALALGGLLFLLSAGFSLIFGLMRIANLTHGAYFMLGAYIGLSWGPISDLACCRPATASPPR
jgi:branched-chain amino acid transport system permease protein